MKIDRPLFLFSYAAPRYPAADQTVYLQNLDIDNLYIVDGSVHVNNGEFNPLVTSQPIAYWASANLVRELRKPA